MERGRQNEEKDIDCGDCNRNTGRNCGMRILLLVYFGLYDRVEYMACGGVHRSDSSII